MVTVEITLSLPKDLVEKAAQAGLLTDEQMAGLLEKELERKRQSNAFFADVKKLRPTTCTHIGRNRC